MEPMSFMSPVLAGRVFTPKASWESLKFCRGQQKLLSPLSLFVLVYFSILPFSGPAVHDSIILEKYKIATLYFKSIPWFFQLHRKSLSLFILSRVISPLISSSILGTYHPGEFIFQCPILLPFHTVHGVLKAGTLKLFAIPSSSGPHFVRTLHHDLSVSWVALQGMAHSSTETDKAVVHVISLISFLWLWFLFCQSSDW